MNRSRTILRKTALPFLFMNAAISADGQLAPANRAFVPFGSRRDQDLLLRLRTRADAVMCGARTIDQFPVNLGPGPARYRRARMRAGLEEYNLRVIVSGSASVDPRAEIFRHRFSPILVLTTELADRTKVDRLIRMGAHVHQAGGAEIDFGNAFRWLRTEWGVQSLLCEGGGHLYGTLLKGGWVDQIHLTICPLIIGGTRAPTVGDRGQRVTLESAVPFAWVKCRQVGPELFATLRRAGNAVKGRPVSGGARPR